MPTPPSGTITFLFTDIEGSTHLWQERPEHMKVNLARHDAILRGCIEQNEGHVFKTVGDAFYAAFATALQGVKAATEAQQALAKEDWGECVIKVRMGLHTGDAEQRDNDYFGNTLNRAARLMSAGHGGQTLVSSATQELIRDKLPNGAVLADLGERRLKDLIRPEHIYQLNISGLRDSFPALKTLDAYRHNLPAQITNFIGREKETAEIKKAVRERRLVTLTGSGGTGKTRLALQVGADLLDQFPDGTWFVELAPIMNPGIVAQTILNNFGLGEQEGKDTQQSLIHYLREKKALVILDNCEHLIEACAQIAEMLLNAAPALKILATSREALGVQGEMSWHVPSLTLPDVKRLLPTEQVVQYEAVRLFIECSRLAQPQFETTDENVHHITQICSRLDGIPLAIELAAARVKTLNVAQIASRLDDRFRLLTGGSRTALPRQQTLRALIDWSHNLLENEEKKLFRRLAIFVGGWTLDAVEQICGEADGALDVLDLLTRLVDKSLVLADASLERYRMLETTRQYAREMLLASEETETYRNRHLEYFLKIAEVAEVELRGRGQQAWMARLEGEHDNLRAALEWSLETKPEFCLRIAAALFEFWDTRGYISEAAGWYQSALEKTSHLEPTPVRVNALIGLMATAGRQSDIEKWKMILEEEFSLAQQLGYKKGMAYGLTSRGLLIEYFENDLDRAGESYHHALELAREIGEGLFIGQTLGPLASCALKRYDYERADSIYRESLSLFRTAENRREIAGALENLAEVALERRDDESARAHAADSLSIYRELNDKHGVATALRALGIALNNKGQALEATHASEESAALFREIGDRGCLILTLAALARQWYALGDLKSAAAITEESLSILNETGAVEVTASRIFDTAGRIALAQGDIERSFEFFKEGLNRERGLNDLHFVPPLLEGLAAALAFTSHIHDAARLLGAADSLREQIHLLPMNIELAEYDRTLLRLREQLGEKDFNAAWEAGKNLSTEEIFKFAQEKING